jgi:hypothetical protein
MPHDKSEGLLIAGLVLCVVAQLALLILAIKQRLPD